MEKPRLQNLFAAAVLTVGVHSCGGEGKPQKYIGDYCPENGCNEAVSPVQFPSFSNNSTEACAPEIIYQSLEITINTETGESNHTITEQTLYLAPDTCKLNPE